MAGHTVEFRALTEADAALVASWFEGDEEGQKEFGGFYGVHPKWWNLVKEDPSRHGWTVWRGSEPVGFADVEVGEDATAGVAVYVTRLRRGEGLATAIMRALGPIAGEVGAVRLKGGIRPDNTASLNAAFASGGQVVGEDKDGYIEVLGPPLRDRRSQRVVAAIRRLVAPPSWRLGGALGGARPVRPTVSCVARGSVDTRPEPVPEPPRW